MSVGEIISVQKEGVVLALRRLRLNLQRREELMRAMGAAMLVSIRRTFREQGSPSGSWVPLSPNTIRRNPKKYGSGHKLLIDRGILLNSITYAVFSKGVKIGTNLKYAGVHQYGSRDRTGGPYGPQARLADRAVRVGAHSYKREREVHYEMKEITRADGTKVRVPHSMRIGRAQIFDKNGGVRTVSRLYEGPKQQMNVKVRSRQKTAAACS